MSDHKPTEAPFWAARPPRVGYSIPRRVVLAVAGVVFALIAVASAGAMSLLLYAESQLQHDEDVVVDEEPSASGRPVNVLILGSDTRAVLSEEEQLTKGSPETVGGERSDTIILAHFDPRRERTVLLHFPRDLLVEIPGYGQDKINAAFTLGGPNLTIQTVRDLTGLRIHHYVEVNFNGFRNIVEALGGVEICVDRPMFDELAELNLPEAGCYDMDGDTALAFVRARNVEGDIVPDFARIGRQQQFIQAVANKILSSQLLLHPFELVKAVASNITTDRDLSFLDLVNIGRELQGLAETDPSGASTVDLRAVPGVTQTIDGISYVLALPEAEVLFTRLREGGPLGDIGTELTQTQVSPAQIEVRVLDAEPGSVEVEVADILRRAGFVVLGPGEAPPVRTETEVLFRPGSWKLARVVKSFLSRVPVTAAPHFPMQEADVVVIVGPDFLERTT